MSKLKEMSQNGKLRIMSENCVREISLYHKVLNVATNSSKKGCLEWSGSWWQEFQRKWGYVMSMFNFCVVDMVTKEILFESDSYSECYDFYEENEDFYCMNVVDSTDL